MCLSKNFWLRCSSSSYRLYLVVGSQAPKGTVAVLEMSVDETWTLGLQGNLKARELGEYARMT